MKYYLQLETDNKYFRLQKDETWRLLENIKIEESDFLTSEENDIIKIQKVNSTINLDGNDWKLNPTSSTLFADDSVDYEVYTKREIKPSIPTKEQLIDVIANGDDKKNNTIILKTNGIYEIREIQNIDLTIKYPTIVVRNETFIAGNGYIGKEASQDESFVNDIYTESLEYWLIHLEKGKTNMFSDGMMLHRKLDEVIAEIRTLNI